MSSASGIKVSPEVTDAWSTACQAGLDNPVRAIVLHIDGDSFNLKESISSSGTYKEDISALPRDSKTCSTYIYRTDTKSGGNWQWILITFVPDNAGVRSKMLHASSKAGLLKSLGEGRFRHNMFFTSSDDLTPSAFAAHLDHLDAPPPMSETEKALAQIKISEAEEASARVARLFGGDAKSQDHSSPGIGLWSNALKPTGNAMTAVSGLAGPAKGTLKWGSGVEQALAQLKSGHSDGMAVFLHIEPKSETLVLADSVGEQPLVLSPAKLSSKLPPKEPCYTFYAWPSALAAPQPTARLEKTPSAQREHSDTEDLDSTPTGAAIESSQPSNVTMIYTCPSASPVRYRMIYSSSLRGVMKEASTLIGLTIDRKLETSDIADLTESYLRSEIMPSVEEHVSTNRYRSNIKSASTDDAGRRSPIVRQPVRSATAISQAQSAQASPAMGGSVTPQYGSEQNTRGELPESAFSMFGPRVNLSPGGGAGFARPRPAGRR